MQHMPLQPKPACNAGHSHVWSRVDVRLLFCPCCRELVFEANGTISGMVSLGGERITFVEPVNPATTGVYCITNTATSGCVQNTSSNVLFWQLRL
jgi:hypothetical protein